MPKKYLTLVTTKGKQKIMKATSTGKKVAINKIKIGDGNGSSYLIDENQTSLKRVVYESDITSYTADPVNPNTLFVESLIPSDTGGFYIREIGLFDDEGDLIVISSYEETYKPVALEGSTMELFIRIALVLSNMNSITIVVDPSIVMASKTDLTKIYKLIGDLGKASNTFTNINSVVDMLLEIKADFTKIDLKDTAIQLTGTTWKDKKLNEFIKDTDTKIGTINDLKTTNKTNVVRAINECVDKDTNIISTIGAYKSAVDDYSTNLGIYVEKHKQANDKLEALRGV